MLSDLKARVTVGENEGVLNLARDSFYYMVGKVAPGVAGLLSVVVFSRLVGIEEYGRFAFLLASGRMAAAFGAGWVNQAVLRFYGRYSAFPKVVWKTILRAVGVVSAGLVVTVALVWILKAIGLWESDLTRDLSISAVVLGVGFAVVQMLYGTTLSLIRAQLRAGAVVRLETIRAVLAIAAPVLLVLLWGQGASALLLGTIGAVLVAVLLADRTGQGSNHHGVAEVAADVGSNGASLGTKGMLRTFWKYGWPLSFWLGFTTAFQVSDRFLIQYFYNFGDAGVYAGIYDIVVRSYSLLFMPITLAAHPRIMDAFNAGRSEEGSGLIWTSIVWQVLLFVPMGLVLWWVGGPVLALLLPDINPEAASALVLPLAAGGLLWQLALLVHKPLEVAHRTVWMLGIIAASWGANVLFVAWTLPRWGLAAAAYGYVAAGFLYIVACALLSRLPSVRRRLAEDVTVHPEPSEVCHGE